METNLEADLYQLLSDLSSLNVTNIVDNIQTAVEEKKLVLTPDSFKVLRHVIASTLTTGIDTSHTQVLRLTNANTTTTKSRKAKTK